jgi:hypothetical protein
MSLIKTILGRDDLKVDYSKVTSIVEIRHNITHRNGKTETSDKISIDAIDAIDAIDNIESFVKEISKVIISIEPRL